MKNEKLQNWALISEIVGGVAILITLVLLLLGIQQNTRAIRAATYDDLVADLANYNMTLTTDNEIDEIVFQVSAEGRESLTDRQRFQYMQINLVRFQLYERAYIQWIEGNLDDSLWERFKVRICAASGGADFEEQVGSRLNSVTSQEFTQFRLNQCSD